MNAWLRNFIQIFLPAVLLCYVLYSWYKCLPRVQVYLFNDSVQYSDSVYIVMVHVPSQLKLKSSIKQNYMESNVMNAWLRNFIQIFLPAVSFYVTFCIHDRSVCHVCKCTCLMTVFSIVTVFSDTCCLVCQTCGSCKAQRLDVRVFRRGPRERYGELRKSDSLSCFFRKRKSIALLCSWRRPYQGDREKKLLSRPRPSVCLSGLLRETEPFVGILQSSLRKLVWLGVIFMKIGWFICTLLVKAIRRYK